MNTLLRNKEVEPIGVQVTADLLTVELADGRIVSAPTEWFPRVAHGTPKEWANFELMYNGIHWPDLNEDISVDGLLRGEKSGESPAAIKRWLDLRARGEKEPIPDLPLPPAIARELEKMGVLKKKPAKNRRRAVEMARLK
jgi:hypothetical protein